MANGTGNIREFINTGRLVLNSLEESMPVFAQFGQIINLLNQINTNISIINVDIASIKRDVNQLKDDVIELKADVNKLKDDVIELKADVNKLKNDVIELKSDVNQADENAKKRLYNSLNCTTFESKIKWIKVAGKVDRTFPATLRGLNGLLEVNVLQILDYYDIPLEIENKKEMIAEYLGIRTLNPIN